MWCRLFIRAGAAGPRAIIAPYLISASTQTVGVAGQKYHVPVIQVVYNAPLKWNLALNNASNLQNDVGAAAIDIEISAYSSDSSMPKLEAPSGPLSG